MKAHSIVLSFLLFVLSYCSGGENLSLPETNESNVSIPEIVDTNNSSESTENNNETVIKKFKILALGDSYTIGQSVCQTCRFPEQLKQGIINSIANSVVELHVIAQTGWTTTALKNTIRNQNLTSDYNLVTLLIGVNNQYQNSPFSVYQTEFPELLDIAIQLAQNDKNNVIVISIPDYAFTPFGQRTSNPSEITEELNNYNNFAQLHSGVNGVTFINITDITREGLNNPELVAIDGLHPSELAYSLFTNRILPIALEKLE